MRKPKKQQRPTCHCRYNHKISDGFDEAFREKFNDNQAMNEFFHSLTHSDNFGQLVNAVEANPVLVLADAVRLGWEAGRRVYECTKLEEMCGVKR